MLVIIWNKMISGMMFFIYYAQDDTFEVNNMFIYVLRVVKDYETMWGMTNGDCHEMICIKYPKALYVTTEPSIEIIKTTVDTILLGCLVLST